MKFRNLFILAAAAILLCLSSCKKTETEKTYMAGTLVFTSEIPYYVMSGQKYALTGSGITAPDGTAVAYCFTNSANNKRDTVYTAPATFEFTVPDTLGTFSITCTAFPVQSSDKYYVSAESRYFVIVSDKPGTDEGSLTGWEIRPDEAVEKIYGRDYYVVDAGGLQWIRTNLCRVDYDSAGKHVFGNAYADSPAMQNIFGGYYTWEEAQKACPAGWRLPSEKDWVNLLKSSGAPDTLAPMQSSPSGAGNLMGFGAFNGETLWEYYRGVSVKDLNISALPFGFAMITSAGYDFVGYSEYAAFWTSDQYEGKGVYRYIYKESDEVFVGTADKNSFAANVRCVR